MHNRQLTTRVRTKFLLLLPMVIATTLLCTAEAGAQSRKTMSAIRESVAAFNAEVAPSTNMKEMCDQYKKNKAQWDAAFDWLRKTDLKGISKGKHKIEGTNLVASVEDSENSPLEKRNSESHYHHIDLQLVVSGVEGFALLDHASSTPKDEWREDVIHYNYDARKTTFLTGFGGTMFLFFPSDWHIAKVQTPVADQKFRVIVIKLDYVK